MIGRNDPCPCGSGKKHKRCCLGKNEQTVEQLVDEELNRIVHSMYEQPQSHEDIAEFDKYSRQWTGKLGNLWDNESIESSVSEYFFFVARRDLWNRHLVKVLNSPIRSAVRSIIDMWQAPFILFGKVEADKNGYVEIEEILGNETFYLETKEGMPADKNSIVFGVVLHDNRTFQNGIYVITSLMFIKDGNQKFEKEVVNLAKTSGIENSSEFYKEHMVDIYHLMLHRETSSIDELIDSDLNQVQQEVLEILDDTFEKRKVQTEARELLKNITVTYFLKEQPNFRKPNVLAAAVYLVASDLSMLDEQVMTNIEIAKLFDVSTSSMAKHASAIHEFVIHMVEQMAEKEQGEPALSRSVGTEPRITERTNWEIHCKISRENFESVEEMKAHLDATMNEEFHPENAKEQAQVFAYDAYEAEGDFDRFRLVEKAAELDPENVDVFLLKAEIARSKREAERLYASAIEFGKKQFEEVEENPWGLVTNRPYMRALFAYGVWLYENEQYKKSGSIFEELLTLNPDDNQGARYLAIASFININDFAKAADILDRYEEGSESDAVYLFLEWYLEASMTDGESEDAVELFENASAVNPFVEAIIDNDFPRQPYPNQLDLESGSPEEAMFIWSLLR